MSAFKNGDKVRITSFFGGFLHGTFDGYDTDANGRYCSVKIDRVDSQPTSLAIGRIVRYTPDSVRPDKEAV